MQVTQAVQSRVTCRAFKPETVPGRACTGSFAVGCKSAVEREPTTLASLCGRERITTQGWEEPEYFVYPSSIKSGC